MKLRFPVLTALLLVMLLTTAGFAGTLSKTTMTKLVLRSIEKHGDGPAFMYRVAEKDWRPISYNEWHADAQKLATWLIAQGIQRGDKIGILNYNNPRFPLVDLGVQLAGAVLVPFYPTLTGPQHNYILNDTKMKILFIMDQTHLAPISKLAGALDNTKVVGIFRPEEWPPASKSKLAEAGLTAAPTVWEEGVEVLTDILENTEVTEDGKAEIAARVEAAQPDDMMTICYTSGTTAAPGDPNQTMLYPGKGVMLSHWNIASNVLGVANCVKATPDDLFLSVLPLAHMFERTGGYYYPVTNGVPIAYARSPKTFAADIKEVRPTIIACVPLLFERLYSAAFEKASKKLLGKVLTGVEKVTDFFGGNGQKLKARIVGKVLRKEMGGRLRFAVSGGAKLNKELAEFFLDCVGVTILEGYGLTETSPVLTCNRLESYEFGTVGIPITDVEVKIAEDGEILARGPCVMMGYLNMPEKTAETIDEEGWFHTGDLGKWTIHGRLKITGRKKLLFKLANGKYVSPETVENRLKHELTSQTMVVGANQEYAAALVWPNKENLTQTAAAMGVTGTFAEICADDRVVKLYDELIKTAQQGLPKWEKAKKFVLIPHVLTVEAGELTPTMKLKRGLLYVKYKKEIADLFK